MNKFTLERLEKLCKPFTFPKYSAEQMNRAIEILGDEFAKLFNNKKRLKVNKTIIHKCFYIDGQLDKIYLVQHLIASRGIILNPHFDDMDSEGVPIYMFIHEHCNPDGYYILEKVMMSVS